MKGLLFDRNVPFRIFTNMVQFNYNGLANSSGVYVIFNNHNWRIYVGSSKNFKQRWAHGHYKSLLKGKHQNKFLQSDFDKCRELLGHDNFLEFHVLEHLSNSTREQRLKVEEKWIKIHFDNGKQCYNLCDRAISREGLKSKNPEETKRKKSETSKRLWLDVNFRQRKTESMKGDKNPNFGKPLSLETKTKLRAARLKQTFTLEQIEKRAAKRRGIPCSEETKRKISETKRLCRPQAESVV